MIHSTHNTSYSLSESFSRPHVQQILESRSHNGPSVVEVFLRYIKQTLRAPSRSRSWSQSLPPAIFVVQETSIDPFCRTTGKISGGPRARDRRVQGRNILWIGFAGTRPEVWWIAGSLSISFGNPSRKARVQDTLRRDRQTQESRMAVAERRYASHLASLIPCSVRQTYIR